MKLTKILGFLLIFIALGTSAANAQNAKFKTWKITTSQSGGFAGINKTTSLDSDGNLYRVNKNQEEFTKIDDAKLAEIEKLIKELKLPGTKQKTVKGRRIYDGIYNGFVITLDGKEYKLEGTSFDDAKYLALSRKQEATLEKLKAKLRAIKGYLPE
jgi:hypothetical protein